MAMNKLLVIDGLSIYVMVYFDWEIGASYGIFMNEILKRHSETLLYKKKSVSSRDFSNVNIPSEISVSVSLCP